MHVPWSWCLLVGNDGVGASASGGSSGEIAILSVSGMLKLPEIQMCLSACIRERLKVM